MQIDKFLKNERNVILSVTDSDWDLCSVETQTVYSTL